MRTTLQRIKLSKGQLLAGGYGITTFLFAFILAWGALYPSDFLYGLWHAHGGIAEGIDRYGPKNRYKLGFAETTRSQRVQLFHEINVAVHRGGEGLQAITYQSPSSQGSQLLLREPEVIHLQDVARLIDTLTRVAWGVALMWGAGTAVYFVRCRVVPGLRQQVAGPIALLLAGGLCLVMFGAEAVFNQLHIWIFPDEHQWFFYYQESLMSTMMLAPRLFAWIAATWVVLALGIFLLVGRICAWLCARRESS